MNRPDGLHLLSRIGEIDAARWDALLDASSGNAPPCLRHAYLATLEDTGCVGGRTGWKPAHATLWRLGKLIAAMPLYVKDHSYGEYRNELGQLLARLAEEEGWQGFDADLAAISLSALLDGLWLESGLNPGTFTPEQGVIICEAWVDGLQAGGRRRFSLPEGC